MMNFILDKSIYFSYDSSGHKRHKKSFTEQLDEIVVSNRTALVTGGTSGIGLAVSRFLINKEIKTNVLGRTERGLGSSDYLNFHSVDLSNLNKIMTLSKEIGDINYLVLNAGGMPENYTEANVGFEQQFSSQVLGHYCLLRSLIDQQKLAKGARVVWTSSGGMYLVKYRSNLLKGSLESYDKVAVYANAKRAQLIVNDFISQKYKDLEISFSVMHPGWVDTPGVRDAIPGFWNFTKNRLRSLDEGADTILWLLLTQNEIPSGEFWFDRSRQKKVAFPWTHNSNEEREDLYNLCEATYQSLEK